MQQGAAAIRDELDGLRDDLGPFGFQWLCACAIFPVLRFPLTVYLGDWLARLVERPPPGADEHRAFFQLSWFRSGQIPPDVRHELIGALHPAIAARLRTQAETLLSSWREGKEPTEADYAMYLRPDVGRLPSGRPIAFDGALARFVVGSPQPREGLSLGAWLANRLRLRLPFPTVEIARWAGMLGLALAAAGALAFLAVGAEMFTTRDTAQTSVAAPPDPRPLGQAPRAEQKIIAAPSPRPSGRASSGAPAADGQAAPTDTSAPTALGIVPAPQRGVAEEWVRTSSWEGGGGNFVAEYSPDGKYVLTDGSAAYVRNSQTGSIVTRISSSNGASFGPDSRRIFAHNDSKVCEFEIPSGKRIRCLTDSRSYHFVKSSPLGGYLYAQTNNEDMLLIRLSDGKVTWESKGIFSTRPASFSSDDRRVAVIDGTYIKIVETSTGKEISSTRLDHGLAVEYAPDGKLATSSTDLVKVYADDSLSSTLFEVKTVYASILSFSPDSNRLAIDDGGEIKIFNADLGEVLTAVSAPGTLGFSFSPDGGRLIVGSNEKAEVYSFVLPSSRTSETRQSQ